MGLESATFIHELDANNPTAADPRAQGDDHIRMVKGAVQNTFPNVEAAVTPTHTELNRLTGVTASVEEMRGMAYSSQSAASGYAIAASNIGQALNISGAGTVTLGAMIAGFACIIMNNSAGNVTLDPTDGDLLWFNGNGGAAPTGNRTLARNGVACLYRDGTNWRVWGVGLT